MFACFLNMYSFAITITTRRNLGKFISRSTHQRRFKKKVFLKVLQYSQEYCENFKNTYFEEYLRIRTPYFIEHLWWLLLKAVSGSPVEMTLVKRLCLESVQ